MALAALDMGLWVGLRFVRDGDGMRDWGREKRRDGTGGRKKRGSGQWFAACGTNSHTLSLYTLNEATAKNHPPPPPIQPTKKTNPRTAGQSEILAVGSDQFLILSRDSDFGHGLDGSLSNYRQIDVFDISDATSLNGRTYDSRGSSITTAPDSGILKSDIKPALYCPFLDINDAAQLAKFGLHNGGAQDAALLNEKWESLAIVPVDGKIGDDDWWFVITISDNDFITQNGTFNFGKNTFKDASGYDLDSQALVYKIKLPEHSRPFVRGQD
ncbi:hypothetical protein C7212DRAFT_365408 [Tuber magnatum]|uniref:Phytase-like domain-containing protein n=1 Tax=Tuber magnatum TaxID=42249 RepID=A0A317SIH2_9PEZI|nr:hypothetical protein C7212DRAFT_365408 [Tuber magnatum]